jgi:hypothetical protein
MGTTWCCRTSSQYRWAVNVPLTYTNSVLPVSDIAPHIITLPPPNLSASWMQLTAKRSFRLLYTLALSSARCSKNLGSSLKQTDLHHCWGHTLCVCAHWSLFWQCCWFKTTAITGRLALIPASRRRFLIVWSEILRTPGIVEVLWIFHLSGVTGYSGPGRQWLSWPWEVMGWFILLVSVPRCSGTHWRSWLQLSGIHLLLIDR